MDERTTSDVAVAEAEADESLSPTEPAAQEPQVNGVPEDEDEDDDGYVPL